MEVLESPQCPDISGPFVQMFPGQLVSRGGGTSWPACSPDLTLCNFFVGLLEGVYVGV